MSVLKAVISPGIWKENLWAGLAGLCDPVCIHFLFHIYPCGLQGAVLSVQRDPQWIDVLNKGVIMHPRQHKHIHSHGKAARMTRDYSQHYITRVSKEIGMSHKKLYSTRRTQHMWACRLLYMKQTAT